MIDESVCKKIYDAHPESTEGISQILELKTRSALLRGEAQDDDAEPSFKLIATASQGAKEFRLWKLSMDTKMIEPYLKIETTITDGIKFLIESSETQIVAANEKVIKFYDFIDKNGKAEQERLKKEKEEHNARVKEIFTKVDKDKVWKLNRENLLKYFKALHANMGLDY